MGKLYPVGIQNFESLRRDGFFYVDKTALMYRLVTTGSYYFLSRPRRFGKSLLISTLEAYFQGKRELFDGLAVASLEKEWKRYPILHLDLNIGKYDCPDSLDGMLNRSLEEWEAIYGSDKAEVSLALRFAGVVKRAAAATGERVVILVDEYDKPLLQAIGNEELQQEGTKSCSRLSEAPSSLSTGSSSQWTDTSASHSSRGSPSSARSASSATSITWRTSPCGRSTPTSAA